MHKLIGNKQTFGIEVYITPDKWKNKTALWIKNERVGDWEDEDLLVPFINSIYRIANQYEEFWLPELEGLDCYQIYMTIHPFYNNPDDFYDLNEHEQEKLIRFDKFQLFWGENFDAYGLNMVYRNNRCEFLWHPSTLNKPNDLEIRNTILCYEVDLKEVQYCYNELIKILPRELFPTWIKM